MTEAIVVTSIEECVTVCLRIAKTLHQHLVGWPYIDKQVIGIQLYKSVLSVPSNLAEGRGRNGLASKRSFYSIAQGSLREAQAQIRFCQGMLLPVSTGHDIRARYEIVAEFIAAECERLLEPPEEEE